MAGHPRQRRQHHRRHFGSDGTIRNVHAGLCLDAYNAGTGNGTPLVLWSCNGGDSQKWSRT
ncbi:RICIN domain-containing protein [Streptomyces sp. NPDC004546]|uniref:RICIN domain-containing protein n=1 Tax=unclassified Streptomyces TaxID=2593676 RepID=UPI0033A5F471